MPRPTRAPPGPTAGLFASQAISVADSQSAPPPASSMPANDDLIDYHEDDEALATDLSQLTGKSDSTTTASHLAPADGDMEVDEDHAFLDNSSQPLVEDTQTGSQSPTLSQEIEALSEAGTITAARFFRRPAGAYHEPEEDDEDYSPSGTSSQHTSGTNPTGASASSEPASAAAPAGLESAQPINGDTARAGGDGLSEPARFMAELPSPTAMVEDPAPQASAAAPQPPAGAAAAEAGPCITATSFYRTDGPHPKSNGLIVRDAVLAIGGPPAGSVRYTIPSWWKHQNEDHILWAVTAIDRAVGAFCSTFAPPNTHCITVHRTGAEARCKSSSCRQQ
ncbi:hypothetical protein V8E36_000231 [Tilletia maclaganii]